MPTARRLRVAGKLFVLAAAISPALLLGGAGTASADAASPEVIAPRSHPVAGYVEAYVRPTSNTSRASFSVDGRQVDVDRRAPFRYGARGLLDTRKLRDGRHRLTIRVGDGGKTRTVRRTLNVRNPRATGAARRSANQVPTVVWGAPAQGGVVTGMLRGASCEVMAWDDRRVKHVRFAVDGDHVSTDRYAPYTCAIDTAQLRGGAHTIRATAVDDRNRRTEVTRRIEVRNGQTTVSAPEPELEPTPTPTPEPEPTPTAPASGDEVDGTATWADEFNGPAGSLPDGSKWVFDTGGRWQNGTELQQYTNRPVNASHDGQGNLAITTLRETYRGSDGVTRDYTSARIKTQGRFGFTYGKVEARMKVPVQPGLLPAFWTLGTDVDSVGWPESGEIDIVEVPGSDQWGETGSVQFHLHGPGRSLGAMLWPPNALDTNWHTYGMEWTADAIRFTFDGQVRATMTKAQMGAAWRSFMKDHFLILNTAVGNSWTGAPNSSTRLPATLLVDWVRYHR